MLVSRICQGQYWGLLSESDGKGLPLPLKLKKHVRVEVV